MNFNVDLNFRQSATKDTGRTNTSVSTLDVTDVMNLGQQKKHTNRKLRPVSSWHRKQ